MIAMPRCDTNWIVASTGSAGPRERMRSSTAAAYGMRRAEVRWRYATRDRDGQPRRRLPPARRDRVHPWREPHRVLRDLVARLGRLGVVERAHGPQRGGSGE